MQIESIILNNFRIYKGENRITFPRSVSKNVFVISGNNGFGKTTFLTALIWCLYGKLMGDVDDKFKREIYDSFGYKNYAKTNLNNAVKKQSDLIKISEEDKKKLFKNGYLNVDSEIYEFLKLNEYSVSIIFSNVLLPSVSCENLSVTRTYNVITESETVQILIDGKENQLTKEVGPEIFINDFLLSKEIAKFFFFDSEKIVSLAEMKTAEDKRRLSTAYSEVLGIKKFEDLKNNLENLRIKFRRKSADLADRDNLNKLIKECNEIEEQIFVLKSKQVVNDLDILDKRQIVEHYQEKLIREGNSISVSELLNLKALREELKAKDILIKAKMKELLDLAPFAIAGSKFVSAYEQLLREQKFDQHNSYSTTFNDQVKTIRSELIQQLEINIKSKELLDEILKIVNNSFEDYIQTPTNPKLKVNVLLDLSTSEQNEFKSIFENIKFSYSQVFKQYVKDDKNNKLFLAKTLRKIAQAESDENDLLIKKIRGEKHQIEKVIVEIERANRKLSEEIGSYQRELTHKNKLKAELSKRVSVDESDRLKDEIADRLIFELDEFLLKLKSEKKSSLEINIKHELNNLMHKTNFINRVQVDILGDIIDVRLFDKDQAEIKKESLSKGEQQLYATAILKALVDESETKFPIFIDSPLQKFDKKHSSKIITEFYPNVSEQVVVFPLLEKELSLEEYQSLLRFVSCSYLIRNESDGSYIQQVEPDELFIKSQENYVYSNKNI
jgi:DNA sulfur modification protein DndD